MHKRRWSKQRVIAQCMLCRGKHTHHTSLHEYPACAALDRLGCGTRLPRTLFSASPHSRNYNSRQLSHQRVSCAASLRFYSFNSSPAGNAAGTSPTESLPIYYSSSSSSSPSSSSLLLSRPLQSSRADFSWEAQYLRDIVDRIPRAPQFVRIEMLYQRFTDAGDTFSDDSAAARRSFVRQYFKFMKKLALCLSYHSHGAVDSAVSLFSAAASDGAAARSQRRVPRTITLSRETGKPLAPEAEEHAGLHHTPPTHDAIVQMLSSAFASRIDFTSECAAHSGSSYNKSSDDVRQPTLDNPTSEALSAEGEEEMGKKRETVDPPRTYYFDFTKIYVSADRQFITRAANQREADRVFACLYARKRHTADKHVPNHTHGETNGSQSDGNAFGGNAPQTDSFCVPIVYIGGGGEGGENDSDLASSVRALHDALSRHTQRFTNRYQVLPSFEIELLLEETPLFCAAAEVERETMASNDKEDAGDDACGAAAGTVPPPPPTLAPSSPLLHSTTPDKEESDRAETEKKAAAAVEASKTRRTIQLNAFSPQMLASCVPTFFIPVNRLFYPMPRWRPRRRRRRQSAEHQQQQQQQLQQQRQEAKSSNGGVALGSGGDTFTDRNTQPSPPPAAAPPITAQAAAATEEGEEDNGDDEEAQLYAAQARQRPPLPGYTVSHLHQLFGFSRSLETVTLSVPVMPGDLSPEEAEHLTSTLTRRARQEKAKRVNDRNGSRGGGYGGYGGGDNATNGPPQERGGRQQQQPEGITPDTQHHSKEKDSADADDTTVDIYDPENPVIHPVTFVRLHGGNNRINFMKPYHEEEEEGATAHRAEEEVGWYSAAGAGGGGGVSLLGSYDRSASDQRPNRLTPDSPQSHRHQGLAEGIVAYQRYAALYAPDPLIASYFVEYMRQHNDPTVQNVGFSANAHTNRGSHRPGKTPRWFSLRELYEAAPPHIRKALGRHFSYLRSILFFAQCQHLFHFAVEMDRNGGGVAEGKVILATPRLLLPPALDRDRCERYLGATNLTFETTPTPFALFELTSLLANAGETFVSSLEGGGGASSTSSAASASSHTAALSGSRISAFSEYQILLYFGTLRNFFAAHAEVFALNLREGPNARRQRLWEKEKGDAQERRQAREKSASRHSGNSSSSSGGGGGGFATGRVRQSDYLLSPWLTVSLARDDDTADDDAHSDGSGNANDTVATSMVTEGGTEGEGGGAALRKAAATAAFATSSPPLWPGPQAAMEARHAARLERALQRKDRQQVQRLRRRLAVASAPRSPYADIDVLTRAVLAYIPRRRFVSLRFLLRSLPPSLADFLPTPSVKLFVRAADAGLIQLFEFRYRHCLCVRRIDNTAAAAAAAPTNGARPSPPPPLPSGALRQHYEPEELLYLIVNAIAQHSGRQHTAGDGGGDGGCGGAAGGERSMSVSVLLSLLPFFAKKTLGKFRPDLASSPASAPGKDAAHDFEGSGGGGGGGGGSSAASSNLSSPRRVDVSASSLAATVSALSGAAAASASSASAVAAAAAGGPSSGRSTASAAAAALAAAPKIPKSLKRGIIPFLLSYPDCFVVAYDSGTTLDSRRAIVTLIDDPAAIMMRTLWGAQGLPAAAAEAAAASTSTGGGHNNNKNRYNSNSSIQEVGQAIDPETDHPKQGSKGHYHGDNSLQGNMRNNDDEWRHEPHRRQPDSNDNGGVGGGGGGGAAHQYHKPPHTTTTTTTITTVDAAPTTREEALRRIHARFAAVVVPAMPPGAEEDVEALSREAFTEEVKPPPSSHETETVSFPNGESRREDDEDDDLTDV